MCVMCMVSGVDVRFFFNETASTEICMDEHTLSLHDALPIWRGVQHQVGVGDHVQFDRLAGQQRARLGDFLLDDRAHRSEEHTSELQSLMRNSYAVFCLKKKK